eukprot:1326747-Rhodomonas_salina.2
MKGKGIGLCTMAVTEPSRNTNFPPYLSRHAPKSVPGIAHRVRREMAELTWGTRARRSRCRPPLVAKRAARRYRTSHNSAKADRLAPKIA